MKTQKTILVIDEDRRHAEELAARCRGLGLRPTLVHDAVSAMGALDEGLPDLVCLDDALPTGNDLSICQMMETDEQAARIPVIVLCERRDEATLRRAGGMCVYHVRKSGDLWPRIEPVIYELVDLDPPTVRPERDSGRRQTNEAS